MEAKLAAGAHETGENSENSSSEDDYVDMDDNDNCISAEPLLCLFCTEKLKCSEEKALEHLKLTHQVDFTALQRKFNMDQYAFIKMINYIRTELVQPKDLLSLKEPVWTDDKYLKPCKNDAWLTFDYEYLTESSNTPEEVVHNYKLELQQLNAEKERMRETMRRILEEPLENSEKSEKCVANKSLASDDGYFSSYANL